MRSPYPNIVLLLVGLYVSGCQQAPPAETILVSPLFTDHMVLQRDAATPVWGKATPGAQVTVRFKNQQSVVDAAPDSSWMVYLAPEPAGGPFTLSIIGTDTLHIEDVLLGEVWLASGQSNMQWSVEQSAHAEAEIRDAQFSDIRLFSVDRTYSALPASHIPSDGWYRTTPETIPGFSAVAYYFGRTLHDSLQVPIGLIHSSWGGTPAEAWTSSTTLSELPDFAEEVAALRSTPDALHQTEDEWGNALSEWLASADDPGFQNGEAAWAAPDLDHSGWSRTDLPGLWDDLLPNYDGIVWFRKSFEVPVSAVNREAVLHVAHVDDIDVTYINGVEVGRTRTYNKKREYTLPSSVLRAGENVVAIRALDTGGGGGVWGDSSELRLELTGEYSTTVPLAGTWHYQPALNLEEAATRPPRQSPRQHTPSVLYNAMIHPLIPYTIKGVIWYQGESNASRAHQYRTLFPAMIEDWRTQWGGNLAFHFVQLANFQAQQQNPSENETWPELREAQAMALSLPNTGMAVTIDIGEADDIHPTNKQDVGYRLALNVLHTNYDRPIVPAGPLFKSLAVSGDTVEVIFDYAENGLTTSDGGPPQGFAIAGEDRVFHWAVAEIRGSRIIAYSDSVEDPVAIRMGWANNPIVNLYNTEGLPASPFRSDDWPGITEGNR